MDWGRLLNQDRRRPTRGGGDARSQFERDFDRAVFSTPVKRLQDKAQVFPLEPNDGVRNRLTHSFEVSSVARGIAADVCGWMAEQRKPGFTPDMQRHVEAIAATCGLLHDLGNPPFGHSGEDAIRHWFNTRFGLDKLRDLVGDEQRVQDLVLFEGNAQTLRIVAKLQILADFNGLNLTYGTLSALCKYTAASHKVDPTGADHALSKPGYFASEVDVVEQIRLATGTAASRNPITFLVEAADDIVYSAADLEDTLKKGIVSWRDLEEMLNSGAAATAVRDVLGMKGKILEGAGPHLPDDVHGTAFRTAAIAVLVKQAVGAFQQNYDLIMSGKFGGELVASPTKDGLVELLKDIARKNAYCTPSNLKLELLGRRVITDLLDLFREGAEALPVDEPPKVRRFAGKLGGLLSENYRKVFRHFVREQPHLPERYHRFQLLTDYVCGMTDTFAKRLHAELTNG